jgi:hypothetical protein
MLDSFNVYREKGRVGKSDACSGLSYCCTPEELHGTHMLKELLLASHPHVKTKPQIGKLFQNYILKIFLFSFPCFSSSLAHFHEVRLCDLHPVCVPVYPPINF